MIFGDLDAFLEDLLAENATPMAVKLRQQIRGEHVHVDVFVGVDADHLQLAGNLVLRPKESNLFSAVLALGARAIPDKVTLLPWPYEVVR